MTRKKKWLKTAAVIACCAAVALTGIPSFADEEELDAVEGQITTTESQIEILDAEIQRTEDNLAQAEADIEEQYEAMKTRIRYIYENDNTTLLVMLFSAEDLADFLNKAEFIENLSEYDQKALDKLKETYAMIEEKRSDLELQRASLVELQGDLAEDKAQLQAEAAEEAEEEPEIIVPDEPEEKQEEEQESQDASYAAASDEVTLLAALLDCEAIHDYEAMLAVATVVMNRVESPSFPSSISAVIYANGQFEPVWTGRLASRLASGPSSLALQVAQDAVNGARLGAVSGCYYFLYAGATNRSGVNIGDNVFFASW